MRTLTQFQPVEAVTLTVLADHRGPIQISTNANVQGWHRHATLVMLAHFFVVRETLQLPKNDPA